MTEDFAPIFTGIYNAYHEAALRMGQTDTEQLILYILYKNGKTCDRNELYKKTGLTRVTVYTSVTKLRKNGYIRLIRNSDKTTTVTMTDKGAELSENTVCKIIQMEELIMSDWKASEKNRFAELSARYLSQIKEKVQDIK